MCVSLVMCVCPFLPPLPASARVAGILTPIAAGALLDVWPTSLLLITVVTATIAAVCNACLPVDTKGMAMS